MCTYYASMHACMHVCVYKGPGDWVPAWFILVEKLRCGKLAQEVADVMNQQPAL